MRRGPRRGIPIWPCFRWGLPCRGCCQPRGALLPHPFTLACVVADHRRFAFCGTFREDRKSTRLNSSHVAISYAVFCLKKKITHNKLLGLLIHILLRNMLSSDT